MKKIGVILIVIFILLLSLNSVLAEPRLVRKGFTSLGSITGMQISNCGEWYSNTDVYGHDDAGLDITFGPNLNSLYVGGYGWNTIPGLTSWNTRWLKEYGLEGNPIWQGTYYQNDTSTGWIGVNAVPYKNYTYMTHTWLDYSHITKMDLNHSMIWQKTYKSYNPLFFSKINDIGADSTGNVYVGGYDVDPSTGRNILIIKYDPNGNLVWRQSYSNSGSNLADAANAVSIDSSGNIYLVGYVTDTLSGRNIYIRKYNSAGTPLWTRTDTSSGNQADEALGVFVAGSYLYVTGYKYVPNNGKDLWLRKMKLGGSTIWTRTYNGPASGNDAGNDVTVNNYGNIYVTGYNTNTNSEGGVNILTLKYNTNGVLQGGKSEKGAYSESDVGNGVVATSSAVYIAAEKSYDINNKNIWVKKYCDSNWILPGTGEGV